MMNRSILALFRSMKFCMNIEFKKVTSVTEFIKKFKIICVIYKNFDLIL